MPHKMDLPCSKLDRKFCFQIELSSNSAPFPCPIEINYQTGSFHNLLKIIVKKILKPVI